MNRVALRAAARRLWADGGAGVDDMEMVAAVVNRALRFEQSPVGGAGVDGDVRDAVYAMGHALRRGDCLARPPPLVPGKFHGEAVLLACRLRQRDVAMHIYTEYRGLGLQAAPGVYFALIEAFLHADLASRMQEQRQGRGARGAAAAASFLEPPPELVLPVHAPDPGSALSVVWPLQASLTGFLNGPISFSLARNLVVFYHRLGAHYEAVATWKHHLVPSALALDRAAVNAVAKSQEFLKMKWARRHKQPGYRGDVMDLVD